MIAKFSDPNEKLNSEKCKERVRGTAQLMRVLTLKLKNQTLSAAINLSISELEHAAYECCEKSHWTECLNPIIDAWNYLKDCMDKGVKYAPYLLLPRR